MYVNVYFLYTYVYVHICTYFKESSLRIVQSFTLLPYPNTLVLAIM